METLEQIKEDIKNGFLTNPVFVYERVVEYFQDKALQIPPRTRRVIVCNRCAGNWDPVRQQPHLAHFGVPTVIVENV